MAIILHLDTANQFCSVALSSANQLIALRETNEKNAHSRVITLFIDEILNETHISPTDLHAVAVSMGPGSYTGLRIGVSAAKGLCYAIDKPLISVSTLQAMAAGTIARIQNLPIQKEGLIFCPMIDARRMEVYSALYSENLKELRDIRAQVIDENSFAEELKKNVIVFSGDGAEKCKDILSSNKNALFVDDFHTSAKYMISIADKKFANQQFEDVAYFEPFYLKEFKAGASRVKGLR